MSCIEGSVVFNFRRSHMLPPRPAGKKRGGKHSATAATRVGSPPQNEHTTPPEPMHEPHALSNVIMVFMARRKKL